MPCYTAPLSTAGLCPTFTHVVTSLKGPTVTVVKCEDNIFGGYTEESWESGKIISERIQLHRE